MPNSLKQFINKIVLRIDPRIGVMTTLLVIFVPMIVLFVYTNNQQQKNARENVSKKTDLLVNMTALYQKQLIESSQQLLSSISVLPRIKDKSRTEDCNSYITEILRNNRQYTNIAVADLNGNIYCSGQDLKNEINISDRSYFKNTVSTKEFTIGEYLINRITQLPTIHLSYPVFDDSQNVSGVISLALNLNWLNQIINYIDLPKGADFFMIDSYGFVLTRYPSMENIVGTNISQYSIIQKILSEKSGSVVMKGIDGETKIFSYKPLTDMNRIFVVIGYRQEMANKESSLIYRQNLFILSVVALVAFLLSGLVGQILIVNREVELKKLNDMKDEFLSVASHQLRTPLGSIKWNIEMLLAGDMGKLENEVEETIKQISESNSRMITLVDDLLNVGRIGQGRVADEPVITDIIEIIQGAIKEMESLATQQSVTIKFVSNKGVIPKILLDPKRFREVIQNLLSNAVKYNRPHGKVKVTVYPEDKKVVIVVADTGIGIPKADWEKLFSKFFRAENAVLAQTEGSGLGLFVVKSYIEAWGGEVSFESKIGVGSTFIITLPVTVKNHVLDINLAAKPHTI